MNTVNGVRLRFFNSNEFTDRFTGINWSFRMCPRLLVLLDALRSAWGQPISISNGAGAIGRDKGSSMHNWTAHGEVRAVDIIPRGVEMRQDAERFLHLAKTLGFTGLGVYPDWRQGCGFHVDTRDATGSHVAKWGMIGGRYVSMQAALETMPQ
jgi:hypothetical protein